MVGSAAFDRAAITMPSRSAPFRLAAFLGPRETGIK
jgi:hypothetical protein